MTLYEDSYTLRDMPSPTPTEYAAVVAGEVRAEMGRKRKSQADLAGALDITTATAGRRLSGEVPFDVIELMRIANWLSVELQQLMPTVTTQVPA